MDGVIRRREMVGEQEIWLPMATLPITSWPKNQSGGTITNSGDTVIFRPTSLTWNLHITARNLNYKWSDLLGKTVKISFDAEITGYGGASGQSISATPTLFSRYDPSGALGRQKYASAVAKANQNGEVHAEHTWVIDSNTFTNGSGGSTSSWVGTRVYCYMNSGAVIVLKNFEFSVL